MPVLAMLLVAIGLSTVSTLSAALVQWHDPTSRLVRQSDDTAVVATVRIITPPTVTTLRDADCQADAVMQSLADGIVAQSSHAALRMFASDDGCTTLAHGATLRIRGGLQPAQFGKQPLWLIVEPDAAVETIRAPNTIRQTIAAMQRSFFTVTERLSDQGRVLVPGLTLGVLGQDYVNVGGGVMSSSGVAGSSESAESSASSVSSKRSESDRARQPVDDAYAELIEDNFRRSGIMHLMAVSGGHFMLVAGLIRRLCARLLMPRRLVAGCVSGAYLLLAAAMYPSDSVLRALVMGLLGAAAMFVGRRGQSVSALSWTVISVILIDPAMARSYGFALSSAAVLGIVLFAGPIGDRLAALMPRVVAEMLAMTLAAQSLTLPIQILMEPELSLASVPANLLVSPFVGFATMTGLAALLVSWASPSLGFALAWTAGCGTQVMERVAAWLAAGRYAVIPWGGEELLGGAFEDLLMTSGNVPAALLMLFAEIVLVAATVVMARCVRCLREGGLAASLCGGMSRCLAPYRLVSGGNTGTGVVGAAGEGGDAESDVAGTGDAAAAAVIGADGDALSAMSELPGESFRPTIRACIAVWFADTETLLSHVFDK
nr:ComEC/Rec2 family competence protein [Bifidobacterium ramosum]